jgi:hypothetical protein
MPQAAGVGASASAKPPQQSNLAPTERSSFIREFSQRTAAMQRAATWKAMIYAAVGAALGLFIWTKAEVALYGYGLPLIAAALAGAGAISALLKLSSPLRLSVQRRVSSNLIDHGLLLAVLSDDAQQRYRLPVPTLEQILSGLKLGRGRPAAQYVDSFSGRMRQLLLDYEFSCATLKRSAWPRRWLADTPLNSCSIVALLLMLFILPQLTADPMRFLVSNLLILSLHALSEAFIWLQKEYPKRCALMEALEGFPGNPAVCLLNVAP